MEYATAYAQDITKKAKGIIDSDTIKNFKNSYQYLKMFYPNVNKQLHDAAKILSRKKSS